MRSTHQVLPSFFHPLNFTAYACGLEKPNLRPEWAHLGEQTMADLIAEFRQCLTTMSHSRAGWDFQLSPEQRAKEDREEKEALSRARSIWSENPALHDQLRAAFTDLSPLATMNEIENLPIKAAPEVRRSHSA